MTLFKELNKIPALVETSSPEALTRAKLLVAKHYTIAKNLQRRCTAIMGVFQAITSELTSLKEHLESSIPQREMNAIKALIVNIESYIRQAEIFSINMIKDEEREK